MGDESASKHESHALEQQNAATTDVRSSLNLSSVGAGGNQDRPATPRSGLRPRPNLTSIDEDNYVRVTTVAGESNDFNDAQFWRLQISDVDFSDSEDEDSNNGVGSCGVDVGADVISTSEREDPESDDDSDEDSDDNVVGLTRVVPPPPVPPTSTNDESSLTEKKGRGGGPNRKGKKARKAAAEAARARSVSDATLESLYESAARAVDLKRAFRERQKQSDCLTAVQRNVLELLLVAVSEATTGDEKAARTLVNRRVGQAYGQWKATAVPDGDYPIGWKPDVTPRARPPLPSNASSMSWDDMAEHIEWFRTAANTSKGSKDDTPDLRARLVAVAWYIHEQLSGSPNLDEDEFQLLASASHVIFELVHNNNDTEALEKQNSFISMLGII